jgi:hypothetical protein
MVDISKNIYVTGATTLTTVKKSVPLLFVMKLFHLFSFRNLLFEGWLPGKYGGDIWGIPSGVQFRNINHTCVACPC